MADVIIHRYKCDAQVAGAAMVRFVFQLPDGGMYVADLCAECWEPVDRVVTYAVREGGARKLRDANVKSTWLHDEEEMLTPGGGSRSDASSRRSS